MKSHLNNELKEIYEGLYLRGENSEGIIDYNSLVNTYKIYLFLFLDVSSSIYADLEILSFVIDGFYYFYRMIFGDKDMDFGLVSLGLCDHDARIREKKEEMDAVGTKVVYSDSDAVLVSTLRIAMFFRDVDLIDEFYDRIQKLFLNSYLIEEKEKGCEKDGMEYWKHKN